MLKATFVKFFITGQENVPSYPNTPAIIISNHSSALDIPLLEALVGPYPHVWMAKIEYKNVPLMGFLLKRMHVLVNRQEGRDAYKALLSMHKLLAHQTRHAVIFPEGTRHSDGSIHDFYAGFALLAQKLKRPIIPIVISGMHTIFPKKSFIIDSSSRRVTIKIGKCMYYDSSMELAEFVKSVQHYFENEAEHRGA